MFKDFAGQSRISINESLLTKSSLGPKKSSLIGLGLIFFATLTSAVVSLWVNAIVDDNVPFTQLILLRWLLTIIFVGLLIQCKRWHGESMTFLGPTKYRAILGLRAVLYFTHIAAFWGALSYTSVGLSVIICYTFPIFTAVIFNWGCCGKPEKLSKPEWLLTLTSFSGTFCIMYTAKGDDKKMAGVILAMISSICFTFQLIVIRRTRLDVHWSQIEFCTGCVSSGISIVFVLVGYYVFNNRYDHGEAILNLEIKPLQLIECIGMCTAITIALGAHTLGFQLEEAPRGASVFYIEAPVVLVAEYVLYKREVTILELCGILQVIFGVVGMMVIKISMVK